jgi:hypothetical protein
MGQFVIPPYVKLVGWTASAVMSCVVQAWYFAGNRSWEIRLRTKSNDAELKHCKKCDLLQRFLAL